MRESSASSADLKARLLGGAASLRRTYSLELPAAFDLISGRIMETVKRSMTPDDFEQEYRTGENWSPEEIITHAFAIKSPAGAQS